MWLEEYTYLPQYDSFRIDLMVRSNRRCRRVSSGNEKHFQEFTFTLIQNVQWSCDTFFVRFNVPSALAAILTMMVTDSPSCGADRIAGL